MQKKLWWEEDEDKWGKKLIYFSWLSLKLVIILNVNIWM